MAINADLQSRLISLMKNGLIKIADIKKSEYAVAVTNYFKNEVETEIITQEQYKIITGIDYVV